MNLIRLLQQWLGRLVHRPADLLEVFSGFGTIGVVGIALINQGRGKSVPSLDLLSQLVYEPLLLGGAGLIGLLQPWALHIDNPNDERHPFEQPVKWLRTGAACAMLIWHLTMLWAVGLASGLSNIQGMYAMAAGMNLYIIAHVLFRARG